METPLSFIIPFPDQPFDWKAFWNFIKQLLAFLIVIAGATAWFAPWVKEHFEKPTIVARQLNWSGLQDFKTSYYDGLKKTDVSYSGECYISRLSLTSLDAPFLIKDITIYTFYLDDNTAYPSNIIYLHPVQASMTKGTTKVPKLINIPSGLQIACITLIPQDTPIEANIPFLVDRQSKETPERIEITFTDYSDNSQTITIYPNIRPFIVPELNPHITNIDQSEETMEGKLRVGECKSEAEEYEGTMEELPTEDPTE